MSANIPFTSAFALSCISQSKQGLFLVFQIFIILFITFKARKFGVLRMNFTFKNFVFFLAYLVLLSGFMGQQAQASAALNVTKAEGTGAVRIVANNSQDSACGVTINLGDGKVDRKRLEPKEEWVIQHNYASDGNFTVSLSGVFIARGLRSVGPCDLSQQVSVTVAGGQAAISSAPAASSALRPSSEASSNAPAQAQSAPPPSDTPAQAQSAPPPSPGESADLVLYFRKSSTQLKFVTAIDGTKRLDSVDRLINYGYQLCYILQANAYNNLGDADAQRLLNNEVNRAVNALAGNRQVRSNIVECIRGGQFVGASFADVVAVQRRVVPNLNTVPEFAGFEQFAEVKYETLAQAVARRQQVAAQRSQDVAIWAAEITTLSAADSFDKVGSISLSSPQREREGINACTLEYSGKQGQAVVAYGNNLIAYTSPAFRRQASDARATFNAEKPYSSVYRSIDEFYVDYQKNPSKCNIFVDFPKNLKTLMTALERDRKGVAFDINNLVATVQLREAWAKKQGYENLAASEFAALIRVNAASLKKLADRGIRDKEGFDRAVEEMRAARYSDSAGVNDLLNYLNDKAAAAEKRGATAVSIRDERKRVEEIAAKKSEDEARARRAELAKKYPYYAVLSCGFGNSNMSLIACFSGSGRYSVNTEIKLTQANIERVYKYHEIGNNALGREQRDGLYIDLPSSFRLVAQNASDQLTLTLKVYDRATNRLILQEQAGSRFGLVSARN